METLKSSVSSQQADYGSTTNSPHLATTTASLAKIIKRNNDDLNASCETISTNLTENTESDRYRGILFAQQRSPSFINLPGRSHHRSLYNRMSFDTKPNSEYVQVTQRLEFSLNLINHVCIGFVTIYMTWLCLSTGLTTTAIHALLVTLGFSFLMAEAIMCHYNGNVLFHYYKRNTKTTVHWILQAIGGSLGIAGILIKCIDKNFILKSTHSKLGFAALILCSVSMLSGLSALFSVRIKKLITPILNKTFHYVLGLTTFVIALLAQNYGYETGFFRRKSTTDFQLMIKAITLITLVLTSIGPLKALYHKIKNIIKHFS